MASRRTRCRAALYLAAALWATGWAAIATAGGLPNFNEFAHGTQVIHVPGGLITIDGSKIYFNAGFGVVTSFFFSSPPGDLVYAQHNQLMITFPNASPPQVIQFDISSFAPVNSFTFPGPIPGTSSPIEGLAASPDGHVYVALGFGQIGLISVTDAPGSQSHSGTAPAPAAEVGTVFQIPTPAGAAGPPSVVNMAIGGDGNLWFTMSPPTDANGNPIVNGKENIGRMTPAGVISQFPVPTAFAGTPNSNTTAGTYITAGSDGNVWFLETSAGKIGRITPAGVIAEFALPTRGSLYGIAAGADGNLWVKDYTGKIYRVTTGGALTSFTIPTANLSSDVELVLAPDGALWFPEDNQLGRVTTTGTITEFTIPTSNPPPIYPFDLSFDTSGDGAFVEYSSSTVAAFTIPASTSPLLSAVLPASRSVEIGVAATVFATMINSGSSAATGCAPAPLGAVPASFVYQTTNSATNALTGTANTPATIAAGASQSFVVAFTPNAPFNPTDTIVGFACANADAAPITDGLNTLLLSGSATPVPDIVALAASGDPGYVDIPGTTGTGAFAVATVNVGVSASITATASTGAATLPVTISLCQTNPQSGACLAPPATSVTVTINAGDTPTFAIFVTGSATVPNLPGVNRIVAQFADSTGTVRGETSVAVRTQ